MLRRVTASMPRLWRAASSASVGASDSSPVKQAPPLPEEEGPSREEGGEDGHQRTQQELEEEATRQLFEAALPHVHDLGWSREALEAGAIDLSAQREHVQGNDAATIIREGVDRPPIDLVHYFIRRSNAELARDPNVIAALSFKDQHGNADGDSDAQALAAGRVKTVARARLQMIAPYLDGGLWLQAMAMGALPEHAEGTGRLALETVDEIWHVAGDRSVDAKWYTRRLGLLPGYCATELFMLTDDSPGMEESWGFLEWHVDTLFGKGGGEATASHLDELQQQSEYAGAGLVTNDADGARTGAGDVELSSREAGASSGSAEGTTGARHSGGMTAGGIEVPPAANISPPASSATMLDTAAVAAKGFGGLVAAVASMARDVVQERR